jgi:hypothetical protein
MSTTTNFKRIALVAVAALGLGVLSSVPSNAAITGSLSVTVTNGTATTAALDSTTAGSVKVRWLAGATSDTVAITASLNSKPSTDVGSATLQFTGKDTSTSVTAATISPTANSTGSSGTIAAIAVGYASGTFLLQLDTYTGTKAGTYTYTLVATPYALGVAETSKVVTTDVSIVVSGVAAEVTTASSATSTSLISSQSGGTWAPTATDSALAVAATATGTAVAAVRVTLKNANGNASVVKDSLTVTIDKGNVGTTHNAAIGKSILVNYTSSDAYKDIFVYGDGISGTGTITIATKNAGTFTETITWYATDYKSIVASSYLSVIGAGVTAGAATRGIKANAYDANSTSFGANTAVYAYSSDTTVVSDYGTLCAWTAADSVSYCDLTGVKAGTASITLRDASTVALSTVASNAVSVRVSSGVLSSFTLTTDKASYAPGEKGYLIVTAKDAAGAVMPYKAVASFAARTFFDKSGISTTAALGNGSDSITVNTADVTIGVKFDRSSTPSSVDPIAVYTFYAPATAGTVTFSAKGGTLMSAAQQATASTATITVADSASAALAAVSALAVTVASLKTLITTLTNLVLKIQKKVKA